MRTPSLAELIADTSELPALPASVVQLLELLDDLTVGADQVLSIVERDPSLTSNLLKLCNSAYYGLQRRIGSVKESLILLGNRTVVSLAFAVGMGEILRGPFTAYGLAREDMWRHALATALGAGQLAVATDGPALRDRAFTAGLIHDLGKVLLDGPLSRQEILIPEDEPLIAERRTLGYDHCQAGAALAEAWNFPPVLVCVIRHHHQPALARDNRQLLRLICAAHVIAGGLGLGSHRATALTGEDLRPLTDQGIPEGAIFHLIEHLPADLEEAMSLCAWR
jgi:HD-like signal output (HDOD) protein